MLSTFAERRKAYHELCSQCKEMKCLNSTHCEKFIKFLNEHKYDWHNLKENPEDLPNEGQVLCAIKHYFVNDIYYDILSFTNDLEQIDDYIFSGNNRNGFYQFGSDYDIYVINDVVAWKYIKPFEGN